jgi:hypothetical protein
MSNADTCDSSPLSRAASFGTAKSENYQNSSDTYPMNMASQFYLWVLVDRSIFPCFSLFSLLRFCFASFSASSLVLISA